MHWQNGPKGTILELGEVESEEALSSLSAAALV